MGHSEREAPSRVFARRLRETREARRWTQAELAQHMRDAGRPMTREAIIQIERCQRAVKLDEAVALAAVLWAAPAHLLTPANGALVAVTEKMAVDGEGMRNWLLYGDPVLASPAPGVDDRDNILRERLRDQLEYRALALADAWHGGDKAGVRAAGEAILAAARAYEEARNDGE